jgi:hypothetical protein
MSAIALSTDLARSTINLKTLREMTFKELEQLYRQSQRPLRLSDLNGDAQGAMLAWRTPASGAFAWALRKLGGSGALPWEGKSFVASSSTDGDGINRIKLFGKRRWFPFGTRFEASIVDGQPTFVLNYAVRKNPPLIRSIVDEVREVAPGIYFGPAALKVGGRPRLILFFALSFQTTSEA